MKYIVNENNSCGQASISDENRNSLLESLGYSVAVTDLEATATPAEEVDSNEYVQQDAPALYEWDSSIFAMSDEVFEIEGDLFVSAEELDDNTTAQLDESHAELFINDVTFDSSEYSLGDVYEMDGKTYIKLDEAETVGGGKPKETPEEKLKRQTGNLSSSPRGQARTAELQRLDRAKKLDRSNPVTGEPASDDESEEAARAHGNA